MDITKSLQTTQLADNFNSEIIWESQKPLFDIYFKKKILTKKYRLANVKMSEDLKFADGMDFLKHY